MKRVFFYIFLILIMATSCAKKSNPDHTIVEAVADTVLPGDDILPEPIITIRLAKELLYDKYTLADTYPYRDTVRYFQWNQVENLLKKVEEAQKKPAWWGVVQNRRNINGEAALVPDMKRNKYDNLEDEYGVERFQSAPLFHPNDSTVPIRYAEDGSWLKILENDTLSDFLLVETIYIGGEWLVPRKYIKLIPDTVTFERVVIVDRSNQNIAALDRKSQGEWLIRSMNPATTGVYRPPYQHETPLGIFVVQEKKQKMYFLVDGTSQLAGYSPYASRFSNGGYIHGIPVNLPRTTIIEYSNTLGTTPRSHKCVRNATSHSEFIYNRIAVEESLVIVIE